MLQSLVLDSFSSVVPIDSNFEHFIPSPPLSYWYPDLNIDLRLIWWWICELSFFLWLIVVEIGIGVFMLVALTVERYLAVCRLGQTRTFEAQKTPLVAFCLSLVAVALYLPYLFRSDVMQCTGENGLPVYRKRENPSFPHSTLWSVYLWIIEVIFKVRIRILHFDNF